MDNLFTMKKKCIACHNLIENKDIVSSDGYITCPDHKRKSERIQNHCTVCLYDEKDNFICFKCNKLYCLNHIATFIKNGEYFANCVNCYYSTDKK